EPMHPSSQWPEGVPADNTKLTNILGDYAMNLVGAASHTDVDLLYNTAGLSGAQGLAERTGKGGLGLIYSTTNATNTGTADSAFAVITPPLAIRDYLRENWTNDIFVSMWMRITRQSPSSGENNMLLTVAEKWNPFANYKLAFGQKLTLPAGLPTKRWAAWNVSGGVGPRIINGSRQGASGATPASDSTMTEVRALNFGNSGSFNAYSTAKEAVPSMVFYRAYAEDLTVSGRTYEEVDALDYALFTKEVLTTGGRYFGDTFTDPSTIP